MTRLLGKRGRYHFLQGQICTPIRPQLGFGQAFVQCRPRRFRTAGHILANTFSPCLVEGIQLQVEVLVARAYAGVADFHQKYSLLV